jgi:hypothetical protein
MGRMSRACGVATKRLDLKPLDLHLWDHLKFLVYVEDIRVLEFGVENHQHM